MLRPQFLASCAHLHLVRSRYDVALVPVERKTARIGSTFGHESLTGC
jgi:hypothetical protein